MKKIKIMLSLVMMIGVLLSSSLSVGAIGFNAEEIYESVFVVYSGNALGSGFAVGKNCVVTNAHVISDPKNVTIKSYSGNEFQATVLGMNDAEDIAVLVIEGAAFPYLSIADMQAMNTGDDIYAIGAPKSMAYTLTKGVISAKERNVRGSTYIQIDAPINDGNSGGPLLNDDGQLLGMNTLKLTDSEGIGLAIPVSTICSYLKELGVNVNNDGNVPEDVVLPAEAETVPEQNGSKTKSANIILQEFSAVTYVLIAVCAVSVIGNIVLIILLVFQKKKNLTLKYDPSERTDFDIDILE